MAKRKYFRIPDFSGGLNLDMHEALIADSEATRIMNFRLDERGSLLSRQGSRRFVGPQSSSDLLVLGRWRDSDDVSVYHVLAANSAGELVRVNPGTDDYDTLYTGLSGESGEFSQVRDLLIYSNGSDRPVRYDGSDAKTLGVDAPGPAPNLSTVASGSLTGTFEYAYTYVDSVTGSESSVSPSESVSPSGEDVTVSVTLPSQDRVDTIRIYRTVDGGSTLLRLAEMDANQSEFTDDGSAPLLSLSAPTNHGVPSEFEYTAHLKGYTFGVSGTTLYWSKALDEDAWPSVNSTTVPFEGGDSATGMVAFQDTLLIFGHNNVLLLAGSGGSWSISRADVNLGLTNARAVAQVGGSLVFLSHDGIRTFPGFKSFAPKINRTLSQLDLSDATMAYVPQERSVWLSVDGRTFVVHVPTQTATEYSFTSVSFLSGGKDGVSVPLWVDSDSRLVLEYGGPTDSGDAIGLLWQSKLFQMDSPETTKFFRRLGAYATSGSTSVVSVTVGDALNAYTVTLRPGGTTSESYFGEAQFGQDTFSSEGITYFVGALPTSALIGRTMQVVVTAQAIKETEVIPPLTFEYREANRFLGA